jgi:hypothetical protein
VTKIQIPAENPGGCLERIEEMKKVLKPQEGRLSRIASATQRATEPAEVAFIDSVGGVGAGETSPFKGQ